MTTAPARARRSMLPKWIALNGVSLGTNTSLRCSFSVTSAARSISDRDAPTAIAESVPIEQGQTIIPEVFAEPDAGGAPLSSFENTSTYDAQPSIPTASRSASIDSIPDSVANNRIPYLETMSETGRCADVSAWSRRTAYGAPDAPVIPTTIGGTALIRTTARPEQSRGIEC